MWSRRPRRRLSGRGLRHRRGRRPVVRGRLRDHERAEAARARVFETIKAAQEGTFAGGTNAFFGIQDYPDATLLAPYSADVPQEVQDAVAAATEQLISGEIDPPATFE